MLIATAALASMLLAEPEGSRLRQLDQCFVIERNGQAIGATRQIVRPSTHDGHNVWDVVVHQRVAAMHFDLRDHFVLKSSDLPLVFDSRKDGAEHVSLSYGDGRVIGTRTLKEGTTNVDVPLLGPTWEGNLWGVTFGALPLQAGSKFTVPFYQYDRGLGEFTLTVVGSETVQTPSGPVEAWLVDAGTDANRRVTYLIDKATGAELGTRSEGFSTSLGGDCSDLG